MTTRHESEFALRAKRGWIAKQNVPQDVKRLLWAIAKFGHAVLDRDGEHDNMVVENDEDTGEEWLIEASRRQLAGAVGRSLQTIKRWLAAAREFPDVLEITTSDGGHQRSWNVFRVVWHAERSSPAPVDEPGSSPVRAGLIEENEPGSEPGLDRARAGFEPGSHDAPYTSYPRTRALNSYPERESPLKGLSLCLDLEEQPTETPADQMHRLREWSRQKGYRTE